MPGIEIKGRSKIANYRHGGRAGFREGTKTEEQKKRSKQSLIDTVRKGGIGSDRVTRKFKSPRRAFSWLKDPEQGEKYWKSEGQLAKGGRAGFVHGSVAKVGKILAKKVTKPKGVFKVKGKKTHGKDVPTMAAEGGRIGFKKGTDKKWIQKAVDPKHKGYCTPMTKKTCTPARKALARTFKKKAKTGWG